MEEKGIFGNTEDVRPAVERCEKLFCTDAEAFYNEMSTLVWRYAKTGQKPPQEIARWMDVYTLVA